MLTQTGSSLYPLSNYLSYDNLSKVQKSFSLYLSFIHEPISYSDATINPNWKKAIDLELQALVNNNTWEITPLPSNKRAIGCKWIFKLKFHSNGAIERYQSRLVDKGFTRTEGLDYHETFISIVKIITI